MEDKKKIREKVIDTVGSAADELGYGACVVGGYVRDTFMGRDSDDIDFVCIGSKKDKGVRAGIAVATLAAKKLGVDEVREFKNFGTAMFNYKGMEFEFVGARKESYDRGSRKPVVENGTLDDDLNRRDLTINAIAYCVNKGHEGIIDKFGGIDDIKAKVIRTPLDPDITFSDDPLRMLRAVRFAVRFGFTIEEGTYNGIVRNAHRLSIISVERITSEMDKILMSPDPARGVELLHKTGLLKMFLPSVSALDNIRTECGIKHKNNFYHILGVIRYVGEHGGSLQVRWAAMLHDIGKMKTRKYEDGAWTFRYHETESAKMVEKIYNELKLPLDDMKKVKKLVELHMRPQNIVEDVTDSAIRRLMFDAGDDLEDLMLLCMADVTSKNDEKVRRIRDGFEHLKEKFIDLEKRDHIRNFQPPVNGDEIMRMFGIPPCKLVGVIKDDIKEQILEGNLENDHDKAVAYIAAHYTTPTKSSDMVCNHADGGNIANHAQKKEPSAGKPDMNDSEKLKRILKYLDNRMDEMYEILPDAQKTLDGDITIEEANIIGRYLELECLDNFIKKL